MTTFEDYLEHGYPIEPTNTGVLTRAAVRKLAHIRLHGISHATIMEVLEVAVPAVAGASCPPGYKVVPEDAVVVTRADYEAFEGTMTWARAILSLTSSILGKDYERLIASASKGEDR